MRIGPLSLLSGTSSRATFNLASWHSRHSLVWSWCVSVSFDRYWRKPGGKLRFGASRHKHNLGGEWMLIAPFVILRRSWQYEKWFKDMYRLKSDECDQLERKVRWLRNELSDTRKSVWMPV